MKQIIVVSGPTASGKTFLGIQLAKKFNGVVLNADSMQIYNGLPILSAQPTYEELQEAEHRLYNIFRPEDNNNVYEWLKLIEKNCNELLGKGETPIILGGTGMYISRFLNGIKDLPTVTEEIRIEVINKYNELGYEKFKELVHNFDPEYVDNLNQNDKQRLMRVYEMHKLVGKPISYFENQKNITLYNRNKIFHINLMPGNREELYNRCNLRFKLMTENPDLKDEILSFVEKYPYIFDKNKRFSVLNTIGFMELYNYNNKITFNEMFEQSTQDTRHYAKRQFTWFRNQFKDVEYTLTRIPNKENINDIINEIEALYERL